MLRNVVVHLDTLSLGTAWTRTLRKQVRRLGGRVVREPGVGPARHVVVISIGYPSRETSLRWKAVTPACFVVSPEWLFDTRANGVLLDVVPYEFPRWREWAPVPPLGDGTPLRPSAVADPHGLLSAPRTWVDHVVEYHLGGCWYDVWGGPLCNFQLRDIALLWHERKEAAQSAAPHVDEEHGRPVKAKRARVPSRVLRSVRRRL